MKSIFKLFICSLILTSSVYSQGVSSLTLDDVIYIAQQQSPDALIAKHRFRSSYWEFRTYKASYLPSVVLQGTLPNINKSISRNTLDDGTDVYFERDLTTYSASMSVNQKIGLTGGNLFISSRLNRLDNNVQDSTSYFSTPINIGYRQPIFKYNAFKWDKKIEPLKYKEAKRKYLETNEDVALNATNHFFNLLSAQLDKEIALKNYNYYDTLYHIASGRYNLGKIAENEILQLELNLLKAEAAVEKSDLNYQNMVFSLISYLRIPSTEKITLIPPIHTYHFDIDIQDAIIEAKQNTSKGISFDRRLIQAASMVDKAKMDGRFDAEIYAEYGLTQTAQFFSDVYKNPLDHNKLEVGITIPILDWGLSKGKIKMAQSNQELTQTAVEQERIDFEQNIFLQVMEFKLQKNQLLIAAKSDTVAQKRYTVTQQRYMIGKVNDVLELNNAQIDNDNARLEYYNSLKSYWLNYYQLRKLTLYDFRLKGKIEVDHEELM